MLILIVIDYCPAVVADIVLAQLVWYQTVVREVEGSSPGLTNTKGLKN